VLLWCTTTSAADTADATLQAFAAVPLIERPMLSPDGTRFACLLSTEGRQLLAVIRASDRKSVTIQFAEGDDLVDWDWVNDEWLIITVAATQNMMGDSWRIRRVYGVRASDAKVVALGRDGDGQNAADILWIAHDGTPRVLLAVQQSIYANDEKFYPEVFEVDVSTGRRTSRARPRMGVMDWYADSNGVVRMGIGYRDLSRSSQVIYREKGGEVFRVIDRASARKGESLGPLPAMFLAQPGKALAYSSHSGFTALYELDLETQTLGEEVFSVPGYDIGGLITDPSGQALLGVRYTDTRRRTRWLELGMSKAQRELEQALAPRRVEIVSMSRDQRRLMVLASSASDPGSYYLLDLDKRKVDEISKVQPLLAGGAQASVSSLQYPARDGLEIEAILRVAAGGVPSDLPLIVMPHGGPHARDDESFDWWAQYLAYLGYAVIQPNYRGSTGYGTDFSEHGEGQWGLAMQDDLHDAVDHLAGAGIVDPKRVCMVGGSYGGYAALRAAQRDSDKLRCAVSFAGISDLVAMVNHDSRYLNSGATRDSQKRQTPDLAAVSPINSLDQFGVPVLLVHGKLDLTVYFTQSSVLAGKLARVGKPVRYVELPEGDHHLSRTEDRVTFLTEITAFLREHNPADGPPAAAD
jgi:dipeptidyl aminopeptidase/acylaminoacyl peptidase